MELIHKELVDILKVKETEITIKNNESFKEDIQTHLLKSRQHIILDLENVKYLNSTSLGVIADAAMKAKKEGKELVISGVKPPLDEIFTIVRFHTFMGLYKTIEEAENYFQTLI
ncbi:STAS domain-containing protein [Metabacillus endolithicus]|uniref:Anti-sigma factor antagonist n=1 Tax=Metabacillus endolithicus TaxID=1535204 RepID=A0ABW5C502_9BACI|nr:STAS domain-containing protein [Metabacillus endolithicus]UPG65156.1 STAS domain-containing protein [Metabacillus endolithicus]